MVSLIPDAQIGGIGGMLLWLFGATLVIVFLFTTGIMPLLIWAISFGLVVLAAYFVIARILFRLKRGK